MLKKIKILLISLILIACGQDTTQFSEINGVKTQAHVNIPETRLWIIPPLDYKIATSFKGLERDEYADIMVYDLVGGNFHASANTFNKEKFQESGAKVIDFKELNVNGFTAKFVLMENEPDSRYVNLVFGDSTFSTMIAAFYPSEQKETEEKILKAMKTIYYDKKLD